MNTDTLKEDLNSNLDINKDNTRLIHVTSEEFADTIIQIIGVDKPINNIKRILLKTYNISNYHELNNVTTRQLAVIIKEEPALNSFIKIYFKITDKRNFKEKDRKTLGLALFPIDNILEDIVGKLADVGITDFKSMKEYIYISGSISSLRVILCKCKKHTKKLLKSKDFDYNSIQASDISKLAKILGWEENIDTTKDGLTDIILGYELFNSIEYIEELSLVNTKLNKEEYPELYIFVKKYMGNRSIPTNSDLNTSDLSILFKLGTELGLNSVTRNNVFEYIWEYALLDNERINPNAKNRGNIISKYFINNQKFLLGKKEIKLFFISELGITDSNNITLNEINWLSNVLKNLK